MKGLGERDSLRIRWPEGEGSGLSNAKAWATLLCFLSFLGRGPCTSTQQITVEHQLYASLTLGVAGMRAGDQTDTVMSLSSWAVTSSLAGN